MTDTPIRSSRDSGEFYIWMMPVSEILVGFLVYMEPVGLVYEVMERWNGENPLQFRAVVRPDLSAPRTQDVDPSTDELNLIFVDTTVKFPVMRTSSPPDNYKRSFPA